MWYVPSRDASEQPTMMDSIEETVRIARETGVTAVATHIKTRGTSYWGNAERIVEYIEKAREEGVRIYADQYPYRSSGSDGSVTLLPYWILGEFKGRSTDYQGALVAALSDPASSQALTQDIRHEIDRRGGAENIVIVDHPDRRLVGRSLAAIATANETTPTAMVQLLQVQGYPKLFGGARFRGYSMSQTDVNIFAVQSWVATASDSGIALPNEQLVHPRHYGTFPRKLRRYALDLELMTLPLAIRSMTSLPAEIMNISDRGIIRTGNYADIVVLDLDELRDTSTYFNPHRYPDGVVHVFVNGVPVVENAILSWTLPGLVLRPNPVMKADPAELRQAD